MLTRFTTNLKKMFPVFIKHEKEIKEQFGVIQSNLCSKTKADNQ